MRKKYFLSIGLIVGIFIFMSLEIHAQSDELRKTEIGGFLTAIDLRDSVKEKPPGFGGRVTYNVTNNFAVDGEIAHYPEDPSGNFGETQALVGIKAGVRTKKVGVFAKARPGVIHFSGDAFTRRNNGALNQFALDVGGVLEFYPSSRFIVRFDLGDTIIPYGDTPIFTGGSVAPSFPGTTHNYQGSIGIGFRF